MLHLGFENTDLDTLSPRDQLVGNKLVYDIDGLEVDLREAGFKPFKNPGFFPKTLPNSMMLDYKPEFIKAFNLLGDQLPVEKMGANIGVRARLKSDWKRF